MTERRFDRRRRMARLDARVPREPGRTLDPERRLRGLVDVTDDDDIDDQASVPLGRLGRRLGPKGRFLAVAAFIGVGITLVNLYWEQYANEIATAADHTNAAQVGLGHTLYTQYCAYCHGETLIGQAGWDGDYPKGGRPAVPLDGTSPIWRLSDRDMFDVTRFGGQPFSPPIYKNDMPAFEGRLADADIWAILAYVKSRWPEDVHAKQKEAAEARPDG
ncbi:MAG: c-type cytochrome [Alphaproteobacteria bacterium]|nr:c-type cytochrome [Alphaproteobacteria bacterium]